LFRDATATRAKARRGPPAPSPELDFELSLLKPCAMENFESLTRNFGDADLGSVLTTTRTIFFASIPPKPRGKNHVAHAKTGSKQATRVDFLGLL
jgi:hypothetical protein